MKINIKTESGKIVRIIEEQPDPLCLRVSMGGDKRKGYYLVFRGENVNDIEEMFEEVLEGFKKAKNEFTEE